MTHLGTVQSEIPMHGIMLDVGCVLGNTVPLPTRAAELRANDSSPLDIHLSVIRNQIVFHAITLAYNSEMSKTFFKNLLGTDIPARPCFPGKFKHSSLLRREECLGRRYCLVLPASGELHEVHPEQ